MAGTLRQKTRLPVLAMAGALFGVVCGTVLSQVKQAGPDPAAPADNKPGKLWLVNADEELAQFIRDARKLMDQKEYQRAIEILQAIINRNSSGGSDSGGFTASSQPALYIGLRSLAQDTLAAMPPEGIALYRQLYDSQAKILYEDAMAGDEVKLNRLVTMYPNSSFGPRGLELLGSSCFDHGRFAQAVTVWNQLLKVTQEPKDRPLVLAKLAIANHLGGEAAAAKAALQQLQQEFPEDKANVAGEERNLASFAAGMLKTPVSTTRVATTMPSKREWGGLGSVPDGAVLMDRCDLMLMPQWVYTGSEGSDKLRVPADLLALREQLTNNNNMRYSGSLAGGHVQINGAQQYGGPRAKYLLPPAIQPIVINDLVIFRTSKAVIAVDAITGKLAWDKDLPMTRDRGGSNVYYGGMVAEACDDGQYGLTAGGDMIFAICDATPADPSRRAGVFGRSGETDNSDTSCLVALSISGEGRLAWPRKIGNGVGSDELIRGGKFIGAPVYKDGRLYVAMKFAEAYHLACLDAADGRLIWKCMVSQCPAQSAMYGALQRPDMAAVAVADGKAFMLTNAAVIAAVDADNGQPIWAYQYEVGSMAQRGYYQPPTAQSYQPSNPILVVGRRLICVPSDHKNVLCLDTATGQPLWSGVSRQQQRDLSYVDENRILLSGKGLVLLDLKDGSGIFSKTDLDVFGRPAVNAQEVLASGNGELLRLDLAKFVVTSYPLTPRNTDRSSTDYLPEDGLLGHLICVDGKLIAANAAGVCAYFGYDFAYAEVTRRLESAEPGEKLSRTLQRAKLSLNAHKYAKALEDLKACNAMIVAGSDAGLKTQVQTNLCRTYVSLGNTAEQPAGMIQNYELASGFALSDQDKAHSLLRLAKANLANKDFKTALTLAQALADKYGEESIFDVKIGAEGEQAELIREKSKTQPGRIVSQELVSQIVSKPEGRAAYEAFDRQAQQEYDAGKAQKDPQVLASVAQRWPNSQVAAKARMAAAEEYYYRALKAPKLQADGLLSQARQLLIPLSRSKDPLAVSAVVGMAMIDLQGSAVYAKLTLDMAADQDMQQQVEFADYHCTLADAIKRIESGQVAVTTRPATETCSLLLPLDKVYSTAGVENLGYGCHLVTDQDLNPVRLGEHILVQSDDGWLMLLDSQAADDKKAGGWTAITPIKPPKNAGAGARPVAGLSKDAKAMILCDRGTVCLIDVVSGKLKWDKKPDEFGLPSIAFASAGGGFMVLVSPNGKVVCLDIGKCAADDKKDKVEVAWDSEPGGTPRAPAIITQDMVVLQYGRAIMCWNLANGKLLPPIEGKEFTSALVTPKGLLVAMVDGDLSLRDARNPGKPLWTVPKVGAGQGFLLDASDKQIAWCPQASNEIQIVDAATGQPGQTIQLTRKGGGTPLYALGGQIDGDQLLVQCSRNNVGGRGIAGYRQQAGAAELAAVNLAENTIQWTASPDTDNPQGFVTMPLRITPRHVVLTMAPVPVFYGGSQPNMTVDVLVLDRSSGQVLETINYDANAKKKDQPAAIRGMVTPPAVTSNRLITESAEGVTVYGGK